MTERQENFFHKTIDELYTSELGDIEFHHGDCIGADAQAQTIVETFVGYDRIWIHPPIISTKRAWCRGEHILPVRPYLKRNHDIVDYCDILIACPRTSNEEMRSGTWATIRYARSKENVLVKIIWPY